MTAVDNHRKAKVDIIEKIQNALGEELQVIYDNSITIENDLAYESKIMDKVKIYYNIYLLKLIEYIKNILTI